MRRALLAVLPAFALLACGDSSGPIRIGLSLPLGDPAAAPMIRGADLAENELNAAGGVRGRPIELVKRDDYAEPDSAIQVAEALYASDVVAVIGSAYSGATLAAAPVYNGGRRPVVQLSPSASVPLLSSAGEYTFRICATDIEYGTALARYAYAELGLGRVAILYVNDEYGRGVRRTFSQEFQRLGGEITEPDPFLAESPDVGAYLARIKREGRTQAVLLAANQAEGIPVLRAVRMANLGIPLLAADGFVGLESRDTLAEGIYISSGYLASKSSPINDAFVVAYRSAYPGAGLPDQGAAATYDAVRLLAKVIADAGTSRASVREALARVGARDPAFEGVVGRIAFDSNGDVPSLGVRIGVVRSGRLVDAAGN